MIYEGTKSVEFKMTEYNVGGSGSPDPGNPTGQVFLDYMASNDEPGHFHKAGELKLNTPVKVEIQPTDADMPHQTKSLWIFRVYSNSHPLVYQLNSKYNLRVVGIFVNKSTNDA